MLAFAVASGADVLAQTVASDPDWVLVRGILERRCGECHGGRDGPVKGGLNLLSPNGVLEGGNSGPSLVAGNPDHSLLVEAVEQTDPDLKMPPKGSPLERKEIDALRRWIALGAKVADGTPPVTPRRHWSFLPLSTARPPEVRNEGWVRTDIDRFVLASLEAKGLSPNPPADEWVLARRLALLLHGLLPEPAIIERHSKDGRVNWESLVDDLLASPHFGEQFGRWWLDVARYADTKGDPSNRDDARFPFAWTYRDYVVAAFNADKPFDRFVTEQLAADLVAGEEERPTVLPALGFLTLGNQFDGRQRDIIDDQIDTTAKAFLGLGVSCARCHNHKFDPIPTEDYYSLFGVFANTQLPPKLPEVGPPAKPELAEDYRARAAELQKEVDLIPEIHQQLRALRAKSPEKAREFAAAERARQRALFKRIGTLESTHLGAPIRAHALTDVPESRDYPVLVRGEPEHLGPMVPRRFLRILSPDPERRPVFTLGSGRLELANAITDPANPLTARVIVNRVWQHLWGVGFVATPDDFGQAAEAPADGELLDYLSRRLIHSGWSIKDLVRQIVLSSTFQQSSRQTPSSLAIEPRNEARWRYPHRRLRAEEIHDTLLQVAGALDRTLGGRPTTELGKAIPGRRAVYALIDRRAPPDLLLEFDFPAPEVAAGSRPVTTSPQQALFFMNSPFVRTIAERVVDALQLSRESRETGIADCFRHLFFRPPSAGEMRTAADYLHRLRDSKPADPTGPWVHLVHALLQSEEFISLH
ncbi:MAG: PSD1 domain-containing protein [Opitutaceae bacterium]|nr:PSD1 domain-containing protein [Opitutaceae bacterium]